MSPCKKENRNNHYTKPGIMSMKGKKKIVVKVGGASTSVYFHETGIRRLVFTGTGTGGGVHEADTCVSPRKYTEGPRRRLWQRRRNVVTENTTRWSKRWRTRRRWWRRRTYGGSSQSSGWVSTRPVIIGAYLHEHTSNVPNQTLYVARTSRYHCVLRVYKARLCLFARIKNHGTPILCKSVVFEPTNNLLSRRKKHGDVHV